MQIVLIIRYFASKVYIFNKFRRCFNRNVSFRGIMQSQKAEIFLHRDTSRIFFFFENLNENFNISYKKIKKPITQIYVILFNKN